MLAVQYDFFLTEEESEVEALEKEVKRLRTSLDKVRKGTYARICQLEKQQKEIVEEFTWWKKTICQGKDTLQDFPNQNGLQDSLLGGNAAAV